MALPDFRGDGQAQGFMGAFNDTLQADIASAGLFKMVPKTLFPVDHPPAAHGFPAAASRGPAAPPRRRRGQMVEPATGGGRWLADWAGPPTSATYLAIGYTFVQNNLFVLRGWLMDLRRDSPANAQVLGKTYVESPDEAGARKAAHEFAADIIGPVRWKNPVWDPYLFCFQPERA